MAKKLSEVRALPKQYRFGAITRAASSDENEPQRYEIAVSTETPVSRWFGTEVLSHDRGDVDMTRLKNGAAVLVDHGGDQIGVVESARLDDDKVLRAEIRFSSSQRGQDVQRDVDENIRRNISVGYRVYDVEETGKKDGVPQVRVTRWEPLEVSIVSVPADIKAGFGRQEEGGVEYAVRFIGGDATQAREERSMKKKVWDEATRAVIEVEESDPRPAYVERATADVPNEQKRHEEIVAICKTNGMEERAADFIGSTLSLEQVSARVLAARKVVAERPPAQESLSKKDQRDWSKYSYHRAIKQALAEKEGVGKFDGLEARVHEELERDFPKDAPRHGGFLAPMRTRTTLSSNTPTKGAETVFEQQGELIELLRNRARVLQSGARLFTGTQGPVSFVKQTAGSTVIWTSENPGADVADTEPAYTLVTSTPKTMQGNIPMTRQLLAQSSLDFEGISREELGIGHGLALDFVCLHGLGANGEPLGVYGQAGVASHDVASAYSTGVTTQKLLDSMVGPIASANADVTTMRWITTPTLAAKMRGQLEFSAAGSNTLWQGNITDGSILGYGAYASSQVSKVMTTGGVRTGGAMHGLVFGNWADLYVLLYGTMELVVDPYSSKKKAIVEVTSFQMADTVFRHGESFAKAINLTLTG